MNDEINLNKGKKLFEEDFKEALAKQACIKISDIVWGKADKDFSFNRLSFKVKADGKEVLLHIQITDLNDYVEDGRVEIRKELIDKKILELLNELSVKK